MLGEIGITVRALTLDGLSTHISMLSQLGRCFDVHNIKADFEGLAGEIVNVFLDPCHCLKLVRNNFAKLRHLQIPGVGTASWDHLVRLNHLQERAELRAANKLTHRHIRFEQQKMKVRL